MMKNFTLQLISLMLMVLAFGSNKAQAGTFTYDFSTALPSEWTSTIVPFGFETASPGRGTQFTSTTALTLKGAQNVSKVAITYSTNGAGNSIGVSVGGTSWGSESISKITNDVKEFTGEAASGDIVIDLTRAAKSVYVLQIVVTADTVIAGGGTGGGDTPQTDLNENWTYDEPTTLQPTGATGSNAAYTFIQNNVKVTTSAGAQTAEYFGCNAGGKITFETTKAIKGIVINGYLKQGFDATVSSGTLEYLDATDAAVEDDPVLVVTDVDSKTLTLNCVKQLRIYSIDFYFEANPTVEIGGGGTGSYNYDYEPTTVTTLNITFDEASYIDYTETVGFNYTDIWMENTDYAMELAIFVPSVEGTGIAEGTYTIDTTYADGTVQASPGGDDEYDYPSFIATDFDEEGYYSSAYYLVSGTVAVAKVEEGVKITVNAKTYNGSTVNASFTGPITDANVMGIQTTTATQKPGDGKFVKDGKISIVKNGKTYTIGGLRLK